MRNKIKLILYIFLFITFNNSSISDEFKVKSNSINVTDEGNIINAIGNVEVESNNNVIILSEKKRKYFSTIFYIYTYVYIEMPSTIVLTSDIIVDWANNSTFVYNFPSAVIIPNNEDAWQGLIYSLFE